MSHQEPIYCIEILRESLHDDNGHLIHRKALCQRPRRLALNVKENYQQDPVAELRAARNRLRLKDD